MYLCTSKFFKSPGREKCLFVHERIDFYGDGRCEPYSWRMIRKLVWVCLFLTTFVALKSQVYDDFSDGNLNENPTWLGDTSLFTITSSSAIPPEMKPALRLNGDEGDTASIVLPNTMEGALEWQFWTKLSFNTSANNYLKVFLISTQADLEQDLSGYFLQVGGADDSIHLFRQDGNEQTLLWTASTLSSGNSTNVFRFRITRNADSEWNIFADTQGGYDWVWYGSFVEQDNFQNQYFGVSCRYTSSNSTKFYFDDFVVKEYVEDNIPPLLTGITALNKQELLLTFDEALNTASATALSHYHCDQDVGNPEQAIYNDVNHSVSLTFSTYFQENFTYHLSVDSIADVSGNMMQEVVFPFTWEPSPAPRPGELVVNEIMADVNPAPNAVPAKDYLELYNTSAGSIQLEGCQIRLKNNGNWISFPALTLPADTFLIVCKTADTGDFSPYGMVLGLPGFSLNNEARITFRNPAGDILGLIDYQKSWYHDADKENGGWSLEMIDSSKPCYGADNWNASFDEAGGSPGHANSVAANHFQAPEITSVNVTASNILTLHFNHQMDIEGMQNAAAYQVAPDPVLTEINVLDDRATAQLIYGQAFSPDTSYMLTITDTIQDCAGAFIPLDTPFEILVPEEAEPYDIVFSEIMPDPTPAIGLPGYEYVELYNRSDKIILLQNWKLSIGDTQKEITELMLKAHEYLILCSEEANTFFQWLGKTYFFDSFSLPNSGKTLSLLNADGEIIHEITYSDQWYDEDKQDGGWSLEMINPDLVCFGKSNWGTSIAEAGGTPGSRNSIFSDMPIPTRISSVEIMNPQQMNVSLNQAFKKEDLEDIFNYAVSPEMGVPLEAVSDSPFEVMLDFGNEFKPQTLYRLTVAGNMHNCAGDTVEVQDRISSGLPENIEKGDVLINEVLFNPWSGGTDFVEIFNNSPKFLETNRLQLGTVKENDFTENDTTYFDITGKSSLLFPGHYYVLTKQPSLIKKQYYTPDTANFIAMKSFPAYNNDAGTVILKDEEGGIFDLFRYSEDMHFPLLNSNEGVSLERTSVDLPTDDKDNWHSAAETVGFATPGYQNSQFIAPQTADIPVTTYPEIFSPDNDGYNDILEISYTFDEPDYVGNIIIYDIHGRFVRFLKKNVLLSTKGVLFWDGLMENKELAPQGIYLIFFQVFDLQKKVRTYKIPVVLAYK